MIKKNDFINRPFAQTGLLLLALVLTFAACKENTILPPDLVPAVDGINTFQSDTFAVVTHTTTRDSILTGGQLNTTDRNADVNYHHAIGTILGNQGGDQVFGKTIASAYVQVLPPSPSFEFSGTLVDIDSAVLAINYVTAYGDTNSSLPQFFNVYRSTENKANDEPYYEFSTTTVTAADIIGSGPVDFSKLPTDSPVINGVTLRPQLRFNFSSNSPFVIDLKNQTSATGFKDYESFLNWLGGFYIVPDSTVGSTIGYFDTDNTAMYVYYRFLDESSQLDTAVAVFQFDPENCTRFNTIRRNHASAPAGNFINTGTAGGDSLIFIQGEPGLAALVEFPNLGAFPNAIINKAELSFTVTTPFVNDTSYFNIPNNLLITYINSDGDDELLPDYTIFGTTSDAIGAAIQRVGATRDWAIINGQQRIHYTCNITTTVQEAVTLQDSNFKLKISGSSGNTPGIGGVVLKGSGSLSVLEKPKLNIIFTKIQK